MTWECDSNRHMNVMYYVNKFEHAGRNFGAASGADDLDREKEGRVVVEQKINYFKEVFEDDVLEVRSKMMGYSNKTFTVHHTMYNGRSGEKVATMQAVIVKFDKVNRCALEWSEDQREKIKKLCD